MTVFGIDCAGKVAGCCVWQDGTILWTQAENNGLTHSQTLLPLIEEAFAQTGLAPRDVDAYGVTAGPGSFTGLRIGLSLVKGLSLPTGTQVAAVSTLYALALGFAQDGSVVCALNARRGEVYWAAFAREDGVCRRITDDAAAPATSLEETLRTLPGPLWVLGDGAHLVQAAMPEGFPLTVVPYEENTAIACRGAALAAAGQAKNGALQPAAAVRPEYLRLSQAERERKARLALEQQNEQETNLEERQ